MPDQNIAYEDEDEVASDASETVYARPSVSMEPLRSTREWSLPEIKYQPGSEDDEPEFEARSPSTEIIETRTARLSSQQSEDAHAGRLHPTSKRAMPHLILGTYSTHDEHGHRFQHPLACFISSLPGKDPKWSNAPHILSLLSNGFRTPRRDLEIRESYKTSAPKIGNVRSCSGVGLMTSTDPNEQFKFCDYSAARISAMKVQMNGEAQAEECTRCNSEGNKLGSPCFQGCVTGGPGVLGGSCANCWFSGYKGCSLRPHEEEKTTSHLIPNLKTETRARKPPKSLLAESDNSRLKSSADVGSKFRAGGIDHKNENGSWQCPSLSCGRLFATRDDLRAHVKSQHADYATNPHPCHHPDCSKRFQQSYNRTRHMRQAHPGFDIPADGPNNQSTHKNQASTNSKPSNSSAKRKFIEYTPLVDLPRNTSARAERSAPQEVKRPRPNVMIQPTHRRDQSSTSNDRTPEAIKALKNQLDNVDYAFATLKMQLKDYGLREGVDELDDEVSKLKSLFRAFGRQYTT